MAKFKLDFILLFSLVYISCIQIAHVNSQFLSTLVVKDRTLDGVKCRIYSKKNLKPVPGLIFYHGGAFLIGSVDAYDKYTREVAKKTGYVVISVDYRLAPKNPYPTPTNDSYTATKYIINHSSEFNIDINKLILMGDSAGGNTATVVTQRLINELNFIPKLQVLIYPRTNFYSYLLPSEVQYDEFRIVNGSANGPQVSVWNYLGIPYGKVTLDMASAVKNNIHTGLVSDQNLRNLYNSYFDLSLIPQKYRNNKAYYSRYVEKFDKSTIFPKLDGNNILAKNQTLASLIAKLLKPEASPILTDSSVLKRFPKTYFSVCEKDTRKDQILIYAERIRLTGVPVHIVFSELCYHGELTSLNKAAYIYKIFTDMIDYIKQNV